MPLAERKGWTRLGTVFSLVWLLGTLIYAMVDFQVAQAELAESVNSPTLRNPFAELGIKPRTSWEKETFLTNCSVKEKHVSCSPRFSRIAVLAMVPIIIAWILVVAIVYSVLWIRAGFREHETTSPTSRNVSAEQDIGQSMKPSKLRWILHFWGGFCLKIAADVGGVFRTISFSPRGTPESAQNAAITAAVLTAILLGLGYFLSYLAVSALDRATMRPGLRKAILVALPLAYFFLAVLLAKLISIFTGTTR